MPSYFPHIFPLSCPKVSSFQRKLTGHRCHGYWTLILAVILLICDPSLWPQCSGNPPFFPDNVYISNNIEISTISTVIFFLISFVIEFLFVFSHSVFLVYRFQLSIIVSFNFEFLNKYNFIHMNQDFLSKWDSSGYHMLYYDLD